MRKRIVVIMLTVVILLVSTTVNIFGIWGDSISSIKVANKSLDFTKGEEGLSSDPNPCKGCDEEFNLIKKAQVVNVDNPDEWHENKVDAYRGDKLRFRIEMFHSGSIDIMLTVVKDILPSNLAYEVGSAYWFYESTPNKQHTPDNEIIEHIGGKTIITWEFNDVPLPYYGKIILIFNANATSCGNDENYAEMRVCSCKCKVAEDTIPVNITCPPCGNPGICVSKTVAKDSHTDFHKDVSGDYSSFGGYVKFKIDVENTGDVPLDVSVVDTLPNGFSFQYAEDSPPGSVVNVGDRVYWNFSLGVGCTASLIFHAGIPSDCGNYKNTVTATGKYDCCCTVSNSDYAWVNITCPPCGDIEIDKKVALAGSNDFNEWVTAGLHDHVTFKLNVSVSDINCIIVEDVLPDGLEYDDGSDEVIIHGSACCSGFTKEGRVLRWSFNSIVGSVNIVILFNATVTTTHGCLINNATAENCCDSQSVSDEALVCVECAPCIDVEKFVSLDGSTWSNTGVNASVGDTVYFKLLVKNCGPSPLSGVRVIDDYPVFLSYNNDSNIETTPYSGNHHLEWFFNRISTDETIEIRFSADVTGVGFDYNVVSACACGGSPCDEDSVWVNASGGLIVQKRVYDIHGDLVKNLSAAIGETVRFNITVSYYTLSPLYVFDITVRDILPDGLRYMDNATPFEPTVTGNVLYWRFNNTYLTNGSHIFIEFNAKVERKGVLINNVYVEGKECSYCILRDQDYAIIVGGGVPPILLCDKWVWNGTAWVKEIATFVGERVKFNVSILNNGSMDIYWINIWDYLPSNLEYVNGSGVIFFRNITVSDEPMALENDSHCLVWDRLDALPEIADYLGPGERISLHFEARVTGMGSSINRAKITALRGGLSGNLSLECWCSAKINATTSDKPPVVSDPDPEDNATMVFPRDVEISVRVDDPDGDRLNVSFYAGNGSLIGEKHNVAPGSRVSIIWGDLDYNTTYKWYVIVSDGIIDVRSPTWKFTTEPEGINHPPDPPSNPSPSNGATGVSRSPTLRVKVYDIDGDTLTVRFYDADTHTLIGTDTASSGSTASVTWSGLQADHQYRWYAVASDGEFEATSDTWTFRTEEPDISLSISKVKGCLGVRALITNEGSDPAEDVTWSITVKSTRPILARVNKTISDTFDTLASGESAWTDRLIVFGFTRVEITVKAECRYDTVESTYRGFLLGSFLFISHR